MRTSSVYFECRFDAPRCSFVGYRRRALGMYLNGRYVPERRHNPFVSSPAGGRALSALQLPWFMISPPSGFGVITTTGRQTSKARRKCIRAIRRDSKVYIVSIDPRGAWRRNIRANPNVRLRIRGGRFRGIARKLRDQEEAQEAMAAFCGTVNRFDYAEYTLHRRGRPTRSKITELHRAWFEGGTPLIVELHKER